MLLTGDNGKIIDLKPTFEFRRSIRQRNLMASNFQRAVVASHPFQRVDHLALLPDSHRLARPIAHWTPLLYKKFANLLRHRMLAAQMNLQLDLIRIL